MEERRVLDSWKEIAAYLGRSIKTCRRWEHELGLPVHRLEDSPKARVFANPDEVDQWVKKTQKSEEAQKKFKIPTWGIFFFFVIAVLIILTAVIWKPFYRKEPTSPLIPKPLVAILYFENNSGDPDLDNWKDGLSSLLTRDLSQSRFLRVLDDPTVYGILKNLGLLGSEKYTLEDLQKIAKVGTSHLLMGNYLTAGERFIINISLFDARTGNISKHLKEEAQNEDAIYDSVDNLTKNIKSALNIPDQLIDEDIDRMIADVYTSHPKALQYYIEGERLHHAKEYSQALESLQKANELDPEFAMAYRIMGLIYYNRKEYAKSYTLLDKAYQLKDRLPEREQLLLEADFFLQKEETYDKALDVYKKILERYPDDFQARHELRWLYNDMGELDLAIKEGKYILHNLGHTKSRIVYINLVNNLSCKGDYTKAREYYEMVFNEIPPISVDYSCMWDLFCLEKNFDAALKTLEKGRALFPDAQLLKIDLGYHYLYTDELEKARQVFEEYSKFEKGFDAFEPLIQVGLVQGKFTQVLSDLEAARSILMEADNLTIFDFHMAWGVSLLQLGCLLKALEEFRVSQDYIDKEESRIQIKGVAALSDKRRESLLLQACALSDLGNIEEAESIFKKYKRLVVNPIKKRCQPEVDFLEGKIALSKKDIPEAVNKLEKSNREKWRENWRSFTQYHAYMLDSLADAYIQAGCLEKAAETYGQIQELLSGRKQWGVIYAKSYYKMGKIYEQLDKKAKAREKYSKFLSLWKDTDPGIAEVEDAKRLLADLQTENNQ